MMDLSLLDVLRERRGDIRQRWEALLRIERVNTPLANPDTLVYLIDWTLDEVFAKLSSTAANEACFAGGNALEKASFETCECGRNPFVAYFKAARQALTEALVLAQVQSASLDPATRDSAMAELRQTITGIGINEIAAFCALCNHRASTAAIAAAHAPLDATPHPLSEGL